jgi:hypothetical protein
MVKQKFRLQERKIKSILKGNKNKFLITANSINNNILRQIVKCSREVNINPEILFSIIVIEKMNRGSFFNVFLEKILSIMYPSLLCKLDASLGLGQVRVSTAKRVCDLSSKQLVRKLLNPFFNVEIISKLISIYSEEANEYSHKVRIIINFYTTGKQNPIVNRELYLYNNLVSWSIEKANFHKLCLKSNLIISNEK